MANPRAQVAVLVAATLLAALPETSSQAHYSPIPRLLAPKPAADPLAILRAQLSAIQAKGESLTLGRASGRGRLENGARLPMEGLGYWALRPERDAYSGTDDLVGGLIETCARLLQADARMRPLSVGDLSRPAGGRISAHLSHRSGRDADLLFFWAGADGEPRLTEDFVRFDARGRARYRGETVFFDTARNWALVRSLLAEPRFGDRVSSLYVSRPLRRLLLDQAARAGADKSLLARARVLLRQPGSPAGPHDDHFHLRIACSRKEAALGCRD